MGRPTAEPSRLAPITRLRPTLPSVPGVPAIRLESKVIPPPVRVGSVVRRGLLERLAATPASLVSVVAPAGYGKTSFLAQAADDSPHAVAWLSLDRHDDDPAILTGLLAAALHQVRPIDPSIFEALGGPAQSPWSRVTRLSSALDGHPPVTLFLDDLDALDQGPAVDLVGALLELLPAGSRMVLAGRGRAHVELSRRRVAGTLLEFERSDLAFDDDEAFELAQAVKAGIDRATVSALNERAEGWPAALYLGALAATPRVGRASAAQPTARLAGDTGTIAEYLRSEILLPLGPQHVSFLRRTAFLDRLSGPLCDAVLERTGSGVQLAVIAAANRFLVPLDDRGLWWRPHHLLHDLLRADLATDDEADVPAMATRAADWFETHDAPGEAIAAARIAGDDARLAALLVRHSQIAFNNGRIATVQRWFDESEDAPLLRRHPEVAVAGSMYFALSGDARRAAQWLQQADAAAFHSDQAVGPGGDSIAAWVAMGRAIMAQQGATAMLADAAIAVDGLSSLGQWRTAALSLLGVAQYLTGDEAGADNAFVEADRAVLPPDAASARALALCYRATIAIERGDWAAGSGFVGLAREVVMHNRLGEMPIMSLVYALAARVAMRRGNRLQAAADQAHANRLRGGLTEAVPWLTIGTTLELARVSLSQSDAAGARSLLSEVDDLLARFPDYGRLATDASALRDQAMSSASVVIGASALTAAELRLLPYLSTYLSFREIGDRVGVSANTIKSQTMSIYRKLDVSSRGDAVARAAAIGLMDPLRDPADIGDGAGSAPTHLPLPSPTPEAQEPT
jgi:LuxR family maltose regulon positive regulatory protein